MPLLRAKSQEAESDPDAYFRALWESGEAELDVWWDEAMRSLYELARAGKLPLELVELAPGCTIPDANNAVLYLVDTCRKLRAQQGAQYWKTGHGQNANTDLETLILWWKNRPDPLT